MDDNVLSFPCKLAEGVGSLQQTSCIKTVVIACLSFAPAILTLLDPQLSIDHVLDGSQFKNKSGGISFISTVVITSCKMDSLSLSNSATEYLLLAVAGAQLVLSTLFPQLTVNKPLNIGL